MLSVMINLFNFITSFVSKKSSQTSSLYIKLQVCLSAEPVENLMTNILNCTTGETKGYNLNF